MTIFLMAVIYAFTITGINAVMPSEQHQDKGNICISETVVNGGVTYTTTVIDDTNTCVSSTVSIGW